VGNGDGIRFFGTNLKILHNTVSDVKNLNGAHADCLQTRLGLPRQPARTDRQQPLREDRQSVF